MTKIFLNTPHSTIISLNISSFRHLLLVAVPLLPGRNFSIHKADPTFKYCIQLISFLSTISTIYHTNLIPNHLNEETLD